jgi:hypothetical protein
MDVICMQPIKGTGICMEPTKGANTVRIGAAIGPSTRDASN